MDGMNKDKWKAMTFAQKREHIWEYYKIHIIASLCVIALAAWFIYYEVTYVEPQMGIIMTDMRYDNADESIFHPFLEEYGYGAYKGAVLLNQNINVYFDDPTKIEENGSAYDLLFAVVAVGTYDVMFGQPKVFGFCAQDGAMLDLTTVLSEETLEKYHEYLLFAEIEEGGDTYPCGIKVDDNPWMNEVKSDYSGYVGILKNTDDLQKSVDFIEYFLKQFDRLEGE